MRHTLKLYWLGGHCYAAQATREALPRISSLAYNPRKLVRNNRCRLRIIGYFFTSAADVDCYDDNDMTSVHG